MSLEFKDHADKRQVRKLNFYFRIEEFESIQKRIIEKQLCILLHAIFYIKATIY
jgi:hypothetical protein